MGTPQAIDNPTDPTIVAFPYSFSYKNPPTTTANGVYTFIVSGPIMAETGGTLVPSSPITFTLDDTTAPEVANTSVSTRTVTIQFTKAMNPSTIKLANLYVERQGGTGNWLTPINLNSYPGVTIAYNPLTNTATLNYSALPQTDMPTDDYAIVVKSGPTGVTDLVGNELDGAFSGTFPSGNGTRGTNFFEDLGLKTLVAPVLTTFQMTPATDTGIAGDQNTNLSRPQFIGQVYNSFPGTVANLSVYVEFNGLHPAALNGGFDLAMGGGGRGHVGNYDILATTNSVGTFTIAPRATRKATSEPRSWWSARSTSLVWRGCPPSSNMPSASTRPRRRSPESARSTAPLRPRRPISRCSSPSRSTCRIRSTRRTVIWRPPPGHLPGPRGVDCREHQQLLPDPAQCQRHTD